MRAGIEKAILDIKEHCHLSGSSCKTPILVYSNTESSPYTALELFKKAYLNGVRVFVGLVTNAEAKAVAEYASQYATDALIFSPTSTSTEMCKYKHQLYRLTMDDRGYAEVLYDFAFKNNIKKVKVIYRKESEDDIPGNGLYNDIVARFSTEVGIEILDPTSYSEGDLISPAEYAQAIVEQLETLPSDEPVIVVLVGLVEVEQILNVAASHYAKLKNCIWMLSDALTLSDIKLPAEMNIFGISFFGTEPESGQLGKEHHGLVSYIHRKGLPPMRQGFLAYDAISWIQKFYLNSQSFSQYLSSNMVSEGLTGALEFSECHERLSGSYTLVSNPNANSVDNILDKVIMNKWIVISQNRVQSKQQYSTNRAMMFEGLTAEAMMEHNLESTSKGDSSAVSAPVIVIKKSELLVELVKIGKKECENSAQINISLKNELTHERINSMYTVLTLPETVTVPARMGMIMEGSCITKKHKLMFTRVYPEAKVAGAELMCKIKLTTKPLYNGQNAVIEGKGACLFTEIMTGSCVAGSAACAVAGIVTAGAAAPACSIGIGCAAIGLVTSNVFCKKKDKYVCTELFRQGSLSSELLLADMSFAEHYSKEYPLTRQGYNIIGPALASWMSTSETVTNIVKSFAIPWAEEMAYNEGYYDKGNEVGAWVMSIGSVICAFVGIVYTYASFILG